MKTLLVALLLCFALPVVAQEQTTTSSRADEVKEFGKDLAALQAQVHADGRQYANLSHGQLNQAQYASYVEDLLGDALTKAQSLADKWKGRRAVHVTGFTVALSFTGPEVSVTFELQ